MESCKVPMGIIPALRGVGIDPARVLALAKLPAGLLDHPAPRLSVPDYFAFWRAIGALADDPAVGIRLGTSVNPDLTEPFFLAVLSARDGTEAMELVSAYKRVLTPQTLEIRSDRRSETVHVAYDWQGVDEEPPAVIVDAELAFLVEACRRGTMDRTVAPLSVHLRRRALARGARHADFFGCPLRLRARHDALVFAADDLARPFVTHNPPMLEVLLPHLKRQAPSPARSTTARVRGAISGALHGRRPTLQSISRELAMSARTVQRALGESGTSFRALLDEVRNEHAQAYLAETAFSYGEIAFLLGFEDPNSFYRAFRVWNGQSPSDFRTRP